VLNSLGERAPGKEVKCLLLFDASANHHAMRKDQWNPRTMNTGVGCKAKAWTNPAPIRVMCDYPDGTLGLKKGNFHDAVFPAGHEHVGEFKGMEIICHLQGAWPSTRQE
jgi:hypothetical protein